MRFRPPNIQFLQSIRGKLTLSIWLIGIMFGAMAIFLLVTVLKTVPENARTVEGALPAVRALETVSFNVLKTQKDVLDFLFLEELTEEDDDVLEEEEVAEVAESYAEIQAALAVLDDTLNPDASERLRALTSDIFEQAQALLVDTPGSDFANEGLMVRVETLEALEEAYLDLTQTELNRQTDDILQNFALSSRASQRVALVALSTSLIAFAFLLLLAVYLLKAINRPLRVIERTAEAIGRGQLSVSDHTDLAKLARNPSEFSVVANTLVKMTGDLASLYDDLSHTAHHDALTGLPNRAHLLNRLTHLTDEEKAFSFLFLDLDHFKAVNDLYGHKVGDALLTEVARRLSACVRPEDMVARLSGDEFTVLLVGQDEQGQAERVAQRLLDAVARPYTVDDFQLDIFASVGVFLDHQSYDKAEDVLRAADIAMYRAKSQGRGQYVVFDTSLGQEVTTYLTLEWAWSKTLDSQSIQLRG